MPDSHELLRLEDKSGEVVMYFAPNFEWTTQDANDLFDEGIPGAENQAFVLNIDKWTSEVVIQGAFNYSDNLPPPHRTALEAMFDTTDVITPQDQINRVRDFAVYGRASEPAFDLHVFGNEFTAESRAELDVENGVLPNVALGEIRTPDEAAEARARYMLRFVVGFVEGD